MSEQLPPATPVTTDPLPSDLPPQKDMSWAATVSAACGGAALVSLIGGCIPFVSCVCCFTTPVLSIAGIIFGILGMKSEKGGLAKAGLGMSIAAIVLMGVQMILSLVFGIGNAMIHKR